MFMFFVLFFNILLDRIKELSVTISRAGKFHNNFEPSHMSRWMLAIHAGLIGILRFTCSNRVRC